MWTSQTAQRRRPPGGATCRGVPPRPVPTSSPPFVPRPTPSRESTAPPSPITPVTPHPRATPVSSLIVAHRPGPVAPVFPSTQVWPVPPRGVPSPPIVAPPPHGLHTPCRIPARRDEAGSTDWGMDNATLPTRRRGVRAGNAAGGRCGPLPTATLAASTVGIGDRPSPQARGRTPAAESTPARRLLDGLPVMHAAGVAARSETLSEFGLRRVLVVLCVTEIVSWGVLYYAFPARVAPAIAGDTGWSIAAVTAAFSTGLVVSALVGIPVGRWLDRIGPRLVMTTGSILRSPQPSGSPSHRRCRGSSPPGSWPAWP